MSPEQVGGEPLDGRTDIFSLGIVLYECATGRLPFTGKTPGVVLAAILNQSPVAPTTLNPQIPMRLQEVLNNCLEKDPELRYPDAAALRADLKRIRRDLESGQTRVLEQAQQLRGLTLWCRAVNRNSLAQGTTARRRNTGRAAGY
jgi:non-specific serine/threonine protein kinase